MLGMVGTQVPKRRFLECSGGTNRRVGNCGTR